MFLSCFKKVADFKEILLQDEKKGFNYLDDIYEVISR